MTEQEARNIAEPIVKEIVNSISSGRYELLCRFAKFSNGFTEEVMKELLEGYLKLNNLSHYDDYDVLFSGNRSQIDVYGDSAFVIGLLYKSVLCTLYSVLSILNS